MRSDTIASTTGAPLKNASRILGLVIVLFAVFLRTPQASPHEAGIAGVSHRGPGAQARARYDRAVALLATDVAAGRQAVDELLADLERRRTDAEDLLDAASREDLAKRLVDARVASVLPELPLPAGARGDFVRGLAAGAAWSDWAVGVPASVTIAQAILESSWGRSAPAFNLFGLKGEGPAGSTRQRVVEYVHGRRHVRTSSFRAYDDVGQSLLDHASILAGSRHYARARDVAEDPARFAKALQGTYATDPHYAEKLTGMIARYGLDRLDWNGRSPWR